MSKRLLMVYNLALVKSLSHQLTSHRKRKHVGGARSDLYTDEPEETALDGGDINVWLGQLFTYLLALAIAGAVPLHGAPDAKLEHELGAESTLFVIVPWDLLQIFYFRVKRTLNRMPAEPEALRSS